MIWRSRTNKKAAGAADKTLLLLRQYLEVKAGEWLGSDFFANVNRDEMSCIVIGDISGGNQIVGYGLGYVVEIPSSTTVSIEVYSDTERVGQSFRVFFPLW